MPGINKVILIGHVGRDPDVRQLSGNVSVASFPLATDEVVAKHGKRVEVTEWHNIVLWRNQAEIAGKLLKKGSLVHLEGKVRTRSYTDSSGINRYIAEIIIDQFTLLGRKSDFSENQAV